MSNISVEYVDHMGDDMRVANTARVSFSKWKSGDIDAKDVGLINYLAEHEHSSPFRHTAISVRCHAPIFLARQLGKHQVGLSWNEVSRRYVDTSVEFFVPDSWRSRPADGIKQGSGGDHFDQELFKSHYNDIVYECLNIYNNMLENDIAPEQARMILPQSMMTSWIWTGSLQAFHHVYRLRSEAHAQAEAQEFAHKLAEVIEPLFPVAWRALND